MCELARHRDQRDGVWRLSHDRFIVLFRPPEFFRPLPDLSLELQVEALKFEVLDENLLVQPQLVLGELTLRHIQVGDELDQLCCRTDNVHALLCSSSDAFGFVSGEAGVPMDVTEERSAANICQHAPSICAYGLPLQVIVPLK